MSSIIHLIRELDSLLVINSVKGGLLLCDRNASGVFSRFVRCVFMLECADDTE